MADAGTPAPATPTAWHAELEPRAAWALALALGSWLVIPVGPAIVALVLGRQADARIATSGTNGTGLVTAARILAWVNIALWAGIVVGTLILLVALGTYAGMSSLIDAILPAG